MDMWAEQLRHVELSSEVSRAEQCLQVHSDAALHVQNCIIEVMQVGQDLLPVSGHIHPVPVITWMKLAIVFILLTC